MQDPGHREFPPELADIGLDPDSGAIDDSQARACLDVLRDADVDPEVRGLAAMVLGPGLQLGDEVISWGDDSDFTYFSKSVWEEVSDELERLYHDAETPKLVRRRILEAAARGEPREWLHGAARAGWQSGDPDWMLTAVFAMQWLPGFENEVADAIEDPPDERVLREAIEVAVNRSRSEFAEFFESIAAGNTDHERATRLAAIAALRSIDVTRLESWRILDELSKSDDREIAETAEWALDEYYLTKQLEEFDGDDFL